MIRIEASDLPGSSCGPSPQSPGGYRDIRVGIQRRNKPGELSGLVRGDAPSATWTLECTAVQAPGAIDLTGPYIQGSPGARFVYLTWIAADAEGGSTMFRRAKLQLDAIPADVTAQACETGTLVGRLGLTDPRGNPLCASVRPPAIEWSAAFAG